MGAPAENHQMYLNGKPVLYYEHAVATGKVTGSMRAPLTVDYLGKRFVRADVLDMGSEEHF